MEIPYRSDNPIHNSKPHVKCKNCLDCGKKISKTSLRCGRCAKLHRAQLNRGQRCHDIVHRIISVVRGLKHSIQFATLNSSEDISREIRGLEEEIAELANELTIESLVRLENRSDKGSHVTASDSLA